jgi:uncharacterized protein YecE (DUF72 family)
MLHPRIKVLRHIISKRNHQEAITYCRIIAKIQEKDYKYAQDLYRTIQAGKAKIYLYEDGTYDYKRIK